jgi:mannosyltransferase OCH1-like enzyme
MPVPKIIHQTFVRKHDLSPQITEVLAMFKQHNPD